MSTKILVTGGAGYIGSHTVVELVEAGYVPVIIDNLSNSEKQVIDNLEKLVNRKLDFFKGDVQNRELLDRIYEEHPQISGVIHFAAYKAVGESVKNPLMYYQNNLDSLMVLLRWMEDHSLPHLVFSSSCTVYGQPETLPVTEKTERKEAESPYGNTKRISEDIIKNTTAASHHLKALSLRYFNPIGAHPSALIGELPLGVPANLVPFITQTAAGIREQLTVFGDDYNTEDGSCIRDYIHVVDLARAHVSSIDWLLEVTQQTFYDVFNVGVGQGYSVLQLIRKFEEVTGESLRYKIGTRRPGDVEQIYASTQKAEEQLGWKAMYSLDEALKHAWNWQKTRKQ